MANASAEGIVEDCPTCGTRCRVVGATTKHFEPIDDLEEALAEATKPSPVLAKLAEPAHELLAPGLVPAQPLSCGTVRGLAGDGAGRVEADGLIARVDDPGPVRVAAVHHIRGYDPTKDAVPTVEACEAILLAHGFELGVRAAVWWLRDHAASRPEPTRQRLVDAANDIEGEILEACPLRDHQRAVLEATRRRCR